MNEVRFVMRKIFSVVIICQFIFNTSWALPFKGTEIVMSAANQTAVQAAMKIAEKGGNPVDVAVALVLAMSVTNATFASLGGGGFALVKMGKSIEVLDFRERAHENLELQ